MPIVDIQVVMKEGQVLPEGTARSAAESLAGVFNAEPGRVWVRMEVLPESRYAENETDVTGLPVFVRILHAEIPLHGALAVQAEAVTRALAACLDRDSDLVHVEYAPPGRGRVSFGGRLLQ